MNSSAHSAERRNPSLARVPFEALVEIAAPEGASFEAESVDLSASGMHLKTAYLPKVGTPLTFRFEANHDTAPILAGGQVVWAHDGPEGCEFGVRFADMKSGTAEAIRQIVGLPTMEDESRDEGDAKDRPSESLKTLAGVGPAAPTSIRPGSPVRIHIEGVASPMRATLREDARKGATVGSDLKMLRIGAVVELEDKETQVRRPARVEGVECEIDGTSRVPQLVVKLRYDAEPEIATMDTKKIDPEVMQQAVQSIGFQEARRDATMPPPAMDAASPVMPSVARENDMPRPTPAQQRTSLPVGKEDSGKLEVVADGMKRVGSIMSSAMSGFGAAASKFGVRAKNTVSLLARSAKDQGDVEETRRTTSPAPGHASKPRTLRPQGASRDSMMGEGMEDSSVMQEIDSRKIARRRQIGIVAGVALALVLAFFAFRKPKPAPVATAPAPELAPAPAPLPPPPPAIDPNLAAIPAVPPAPLAGEPTGIDAKGNPNPFGNTSVKKGTRMVLRLDGPVGELRGAQTPNGFVVAVPNRKSLEAAGPLAAKDARITSAKVVNQAGGAELTISFKDTPPSYIVRAKGDAIEIVLSKDKAVAKKPTKKAPAKKAPAKKK
jgi:hypothetical protein